MTNFTKIIKEKNTKEYLKKLKNKNLIKELIKITDFLDDYSYKNFKYDKEFKVIQNENNQKKIEFFKNVIELQQKIFNKCIKENLGFDLAISNPIPFYDESIDNDNRLYNLRCKKILSNIIENKKVTNLFKYLLKNYNKNSNEEDNSIGHDFFLMDYKKSIHLLEILKQEKTDYYIYSLDEKEIESLEEILEDEKIPFEYYDYYFIRFFNRLSDKEKFEYMMKNVTLLFENNLKKIKSLKQKTIKNVFDILITNKNLRDIFYKMSYNYKESYRDDCEYKIKDNILYDIDDDDYISIIKGKNPVLEYIYNNHKELFKLHYKEVILDGYLESIKTTITKHNKILKLLEGEKNND